MDALYGYGHITTSGYGNHFYIQVSVDVQRHRRQLLHLVILENGRNDVVISRARAPLPDIFPFPVCKRPPYISAVGRRRPVSA